jgi:hypothetical protein
METDKLVDEVVGRVIANCTFLHGAGVGGQHSFAYAISNCTFVGRGFELHPNGTVSGSHPDQESYAAIKLSGPWGRLGARLICGNRIVGFRNGIDLQWTDGVIIHGNEITHSRERAISLTNSFRSIISGNSIWHGDEPSRCDGIYIDSIWESDPISQPSRLASADWGSWILGNVIWNATELGYYAMKLSKADNVTVVNNNFMGDGRYLSVGNSPGCRWSAGYSSLDLPQEELLSILAWSGLLGRWTGACGGIPGLSTASVAPEDLVRGLAAIRGGNYWQAHPCVDLKRGLGQDTEGSDGICDAAYRATGSVTDPYPLAAMFAPPADWDGVPDDIEDLAPTPDGGPKGDGNGDGKADSGQEEVASLPLNGQAEIPGYTTVAVSTGELGNVRTLPAPDDPPPGVEFPYGLFSFEVWNLESGAQVTIDVFVPGDERTWELWKKNTSGIWKRIELTTQQVAPPESPPVTKATFTLQEGGPFDHDGLPDGRLVDDAGLVVVREGLWMWLSGTTLFLWASRFFHGPRPDGSA